MKHAGTEALSTLEPVLRQIRASPALVEKTPGTFYFRSKAFLHFHEDPAGLFADLKEDLCSFNRYRVSTQAEQKQLLARVALCVKRLAAPSR